MRTILLQSCQNCSAAARVQRVGWLIHATLLDSNSTAIGFEPSRTTEGIRFNRARFVTVDVAPITAERNQISHRCGGQLASLRARLGKRGASTNLAAMSKLGGSLLQLSLHRCDHFLRCIEGTYSAT
jgi:hypothetical protein